MSQPLVLLQLPEQQAYQVHRSGVGSQAQNRPNCILSKDQINIFVRETGDILLEKVLLTLQLPKLPEVFKLQTPAPPTVPGHFQDVYLASKLERGNVL